MKQVSLSEVTNNYESIKKQLKKIRVSLKRPLTLTEKILFSHLSQDNPTPRGEGSLILRPDRVAMQDATAQMALLQFMLAGKKKTAKPTTVHCDHLITAYSGVDSDMRSALTEHGEVFDFLSSVSNRYGIDFWGPGSGIIHQVVLENYAYPGCLMIGTDSHTPNAGGLGMLAIGVGGADAADVMSGLDWEVKSPRIIGVHLTGQLAGWTSSKDVILKLLKILTVKGGTNRIVEYFGEGCSSISCTGKATITNMGAELGATTSIFPYDENMERFLNATQRKDIAKLANENKSYLTADPEVLKSPHSYYDDVIEINLSELKPHMCGPSSPDLGYPISEIKKEAQKRGWTIELSAALIGSCTNSSYEDISQAAHIARQASQKGLKMKQPFLITPGSSQIKKTIERDGMLEDLSSINGKVLANACGPCIGQWRRDKYKKGDTNTIISSFNRNFKGRNDANPSTLSFITSPAMVVAIGLSGRLDFNPETDTLEGGVRLEPPVGEELPEKGFVFSTDGYIAPTGKSTEVIIKEDSKRLQKLEPFSKWDASDFKNLRLLCKAKGKCTTDHISPAGYWLRFRGHLDSISNNLLLGAENAFRPLAGKGKHSFTGEELPYNEIARDLKSRGERWIIVGEENYGEGSSREHAAMSPRYLGGALVIAKSFARIHETNLIKQALLPWTFVKPSDYDLIEEGDTFSLEGIEDLAPKSQHTLVIHKKDKKESRIQLKHSLREEQIQWFYEGSALNYLRNRNHQ